MVDHAAQQHAVEARVRERQALDVPLQEFYAGMLAPADLDELAADVEAGDLVARAAQEMGKSAGTAAEIDDPRTRRQARSTRRMHRRGESSLAA